MTACYKKKIWLKTFLTEMDKTPLMVSSPSLTNCYNSEIKQGG